MNTLVGDSKKLGAARFDGHPRYTIGPEKFHAGGGAQTLSPSKKKGKGGNRDLYPCDT